MPAVLQLKPPTLWHDTGSKTHIVAVDEGTGVAFAVHHAEVHRVAVPGKGRAVVDFRVGAAWLINPRRRQRILCLSNSASGELVKQPGQPRNDSASANARRIASMSRCSRSAERRHVAPGQSLPEYSAPSAPPAPARWAGIPRCAARGRWWRWVHPRWRCALPGRLRHAAARLPHHGYNCLGDLALVISILAALGQARSVRPSPGLRKISPGCGPALQWSVPGPFTARASMVLAERCQ